MIGLLFVVGAAIVWVGVIVFFWRYPWGGEDRHRTR